MNIFKGEKKSLKIYSWPKLELVDFYKAWPFTGHSEKATIRENERFGET